MISITAIKEETVAQKDMVNKSLEDSKEQNKNMDRLVDLSK